MYSSYLKPDGSFEYALPPRPILVEFSAPGHKPWRLIDQKTSGNSVVIPLGRKSVVSVTLDPQ
jgi:hypothetical protein